MGKGPRAWCFPVCAVLALAGFLAPSIPIAAADGSDRPGELSSPVTPHSSPLVEEQREVVLLLPQPRLLPAIGAIDEAFRKRLQERAPGPIYFHTEYIDYSILSREESQRETRNLLRRKYAERKISLVLVGESRGLRFVLRSRTELFPQARIVFVGVARAAASDVPIEKGVTGTWVHFDWAGTLEAALRLQPATRRVVVVSGTSDVDRVWLAEARAQLAAFDGRVDIEFMTGISLEEASRRVGALPDRSLVLIGTFLGDPTGRRFTGLAAAARIAESANAPAYGLSHTWLGTGIVGGSVVDYEAHGTRAADLALRVLRGERPEPISAGTNAYMFDWRQLRRWNLDESRLPRGSVVQFRPPSIWAVYGWHMVTGGGALVLFFGLAFGIHVARAQRAVARRIRTEAERFEELITDLSAALAAASSNNLGHQFDQALGLLGERLGLDRANLFEFDSGAKAWRLAHAWARNGVPQMPRLFGARATPWIASELVAGRVVKFSRPEELSGQADADRKALAALSTRSLALVPIKFEGAVRGAIGFSTVDRSRDWSPDVVRRLEILAEPIASALFRRDLERTLREGESRFQQAADGAPLMVWLAAPSGSLVYVNRAWLEFGRNAIENELGDGWFARVHPDDVGSISERYRDAVKQRQPFTLEFRVRRWDGKYRWIFSHGVPRLDVDGTVRGYVGCAFDISDLREARKTLADYDSLRSAIFGSLQGHIAALDRNGVIIAANETWGHLVEVSDLGFAEATIEANYLDLCRRAAEAGNANASRALGAINGVRDGKSDRAHIDYRPGADAEERWFEMTVERLRWPEGGLVVAHVDITRRVTAEEEVRRERQELAHVQRVAMLGELTASLAHEINQPLAAIMANAQAARQMLEVGHARRTAVSEAVGDIADDAKRAVQVITRLRALLRKEDPVRVSLDFGACVADAIDLAFAELARRGITARQLRVNTPQVVGDPVQLQQVLLNLIVNACDAIDAAGEGPREIVIGTISRTAELVEAAVSDSGAGFAEGDLERMFEHFVSTKPRGLGMGLAISRSIIHAHGGRLWASRNADRGLTLHVELPAAPVETRL